MTKRTEERDAADLTGWNNPGGATRSWGGTSNDRMILSCLLIALPLQLFAPAYAESTKGSGRASSLPSKNMAQPVLSANSAEAKTSQPLVKSASVQPPASNQKKVDGWILTEHSSYRGAISLEICNVGAKLVTQDLVCKMEPSSRVGYLTHQKNKRYMEIDPDKGLKGLGHLSWFPGPEKVTKIGDEMLKLKNGQELKTTHYFIEKWQVNGTSPHWLTDLWVCDGLGISKDFAGKCAKICMMPAEYGLPVKVVRIYSTVLRQHPLSQKQKQELAKQYGTCAGVVHPKYTSNDVRLLLDVYEKQPHQFVASDFKLPGNYKKVNTEVELVMNEEKEKLLRELDEE